MSNIPIFCGGTWNLVGGYCGECGGWTLLMGNFCVLTSDLYLKFQEPAKNNDPTQKGNFSQDLKFNYLNRQICAGLESGLTGRQWIGNNILVILDISIAPPQTKNNGDS